MSDTSSVNTEKKDVEIDSTARVAAGKKKCDVERQTIRILRGEK